jgi:hypothetical protein
MTSLRSNQGWSVPVSVTDQNGCRYRPKVPRLRLSEENRPQSIDNIGTADNVPLEIALCSIFRPRRSDVQVSQDTAAKFLQEVMRVAIELRYLRSSKSDPRAGQTGRSGAAAVEPSCRIRSLLHFTIPSVPPQSIQKMPRTVQDA